MFKYFEINENGHNVRCKIYCDNIREIKKTVLFVHGFAGHKDNSTAEKLADRLLTKYKGIAVLTFNLPCHGDDVKKKPELDDFMTYIGLVTKYAKETLKTEKLYCFAISFGAYLTLRYIHDNGNPFEKIILRCPAINIYESLTGKIMRAGDMEKLEKGKSVSVGFDIKVEVTGAFLEELKKADIREEEFLDFADDLLVIQGTDDEVISFEAVRNFCDDNVIEFIPVTGADHRFRKPGNAELVTKKLIEFFEF